VALKVYFHKNICGSDFKLLNPLPPGAEDDAPAVVKAVPKASTDATQKKAGAGKKTTVK
ncbi:MAG: hypothetical protein HY074_03105, partial [Deltaproteobacteria bacterium]|nr:hypothetical protein [Deltaproteobacteria bacterium]